MKYAIIVTLIIGVLFFSGCSGSSNQTTTTLKQVTTTIRQALPTTTLALTPTTILTATTLRETTTTVQLANTYNVQIKNYAFSPAELTIKRGDTITWTNLDSMPHTVTSDFGEVISSGTLSSGGTYSKKFDKIIGTISYHCSLHPSMKGRVVVE